MMMPFLMIMTISQVQGWWGEDQLWLPVAGQICHLHCWTQVELHRNNHHNRHNHNHHDHHNQHHHDTIIFHPEASTQKFLKVPTPPVLTWWRWIIIFSILIIIIIIIISIIIRINIIITIMMLMSLLKENDLRSIAFPCISTGIYGYPQVFILLWWYSDDDYGKIWC